ncbi:vitellogenin-2-like isoform X2 [Homalodisca vitripennis]|uniref:vitellogenin-2-like isoform X2 n=1 Tax=Homalodisca vitripennis TaxID=197043 RepID=UPI001EEB327C|nr:vitellogenin-2-like isoform X2 [Homalodisca vitripennis]
MGWTLFLPFLVLSVVFVGCLSVEYGWPPQKEFVFSVEGQDLTGLPGLKPQYSGFRYGGEIRVQSHSPTFLLLKFFKFHHIRIHEELPEGWWNGPDPKNYTSIKIPFIRSTTVVKLSKFKSPELFTDESMEDWQLNFVKGIVSNILTFQGQGKSFEHSSNKMELPESKDVFSVMEESVVGRCEVIYEMGQLPRQLAPHNSKLCEDQDIWEITKTRNYKNCEVLSEDHSHLPVHDCTPGGSNCGQFWTRASVTQMIGCGKKNRFLLLSSVSSSVINTQLHLQNNSQGVLNSNLNVTLISINNIDEKFSAPQGKKNHKTLLYSHTPPKRESYAQHCQGSGTESNEEPSEESQLKEKLSQELGHKPLIKAHKDKRDIRRKFGRIYKRESIEERGNTYPDIIYTYPDIVHEDNVSEKMDQNESRLSPPHQRFNIFAEGHRSLFDLPCMGPKLKQVVEDIASDLENTNILPEKNILEKFTRAVEICRTLPFPELSAVKEEVFEIHSSSTSNVKNSERAVFRDVVVMCGTYPALMMIKDWILSRQVDSEEAAEIMTSFPSHVISPSKYYMQDLFETVQEISKRYDQVLVSSAVLAMSNLVRVACVNSKTRQHMFSRIVRPECDNEITARYITWLEKQMDSDPNLRRVYIQAIGNVGSPETIAVLRKCVHNSQYSSYLQTSAVFAMRYQVIHKSPKVVPVLMSLYHNYSLPIGTRLAAVALLVYSDPGIAVWQRLAISTWYEPSPAVAQFVASSVRTMATSQDSLYSHIARSALLVLPLTKPIKVKAHEPYNLMTSWFTSDMEKQILEQLSWMRFYNFSNLYYRHSSRSSGFFRTNMEASFSVANIDALWKAMKEMLTPYSNIPHADVNDKPRTLTRIREALGLHTRSLPHLEADLHLKINNMVERMVVINKDTFKSWVKEGHRMVTEGFLNGKSMTYQKTDMNSFHISTTTELGFPVQFNVRTPWIVKSKADFNLTGNSLIFDYAFVYSSQMISSISVMSSWTDIEYSAGTYATNYIQLPPFRAVLNFNPAEQVVKLTIAYVNQHRLFYLNMQPYTSRQRITYYQPKLLHSDTIKIKLGKSSQTPLPWLSHYLNNIYTSEDKEHFDPLYFLRQAREVMGFPLLMPNMEHRSFETVMNPLHPVIMNFSMSSVSKSNKFFESKSSQGCGSVLNELYNALFKKETPVQESRTAIDIVDTVNTQVPKALKFFMTGRSKPTSDEKEQSTAQEKVLLVDSLSHTVGSYQVFPMTYVSASGSFNASEIDPFVNTINGSSQSYLIQHALSDINSGKAVVFAFNMWSYDPVRPTKLTAYLTYSTSYSNRVSRYGLFIRSNCTELKLTTVHEAPIDIATKIKRQLSEDLQQKFYIDGVYKTNVYTVYAFAKGNVGLSRAKLTQL